MSCISPMSNFEVLLEHGEMVLSPLTFIVGCIH